MTHHRSMILTYSRSRRILQFTQKKLSIVIGYIIRYIKLHAICYEELGKKKRVCTLRNYITIKYLRQRQCRLTFW